MFERYTENAKRAVFYARYEASERGLPEISLPCLLLGTMRARNSHFTLETSKRIESEIDYKFPKVAEKIPAGIDIPIDSEVRKVFQIAAENKESIGTSDLIRAMIDVGFVKMAL